MNKIYLPTFQQLKLFEAVARHGSVTKAAQEAHLSQPSVSMQIRALEDRLGVKLTEQMGKTLYITKAGEEVRQAAQDVLQRLNEMADHLEANQTKISGTLSLGVVTNAKYFLPQLLGAFKRAHAEVNAQLEITNRAILLDRMANNYDDLYIMGQPPMNRNLLAKPILENHIVFIAPSNHPLAHQKNIDLATISKEPLIGREAGSGTRVAVEGLFDQAQLSLHSHMEFDDSEAIKQAVISGLGIAYISRHALRLELLADEITILDVTGFPLKRQWFAVHHKEKQLSNAAKAFLDFIDDTETFVYPIIPPEKEWY